VSEESRILEELEKFRDWASGAYNKSTVAEYISALKQYFSFYGGLPRPDDPEI
jgi:hypothetical protein